MTLHYRIPCSISLYYTAQAPPASAAAAAAAGSTAEETIYIWTLTNIYIYRCLYVYIHIHVYIYIYREREVLIYFAFNQAQIEEQQPWITATANNAWQAMLIHRLPNGVRTNVCFAEVLQYTIIMT